uniref:Uncharacterized protein n=1 Tax=Glossina brevipalpis TaxID=37001 RepID=A0A1A9W721_9MUSC
MNLSENFELLWPKLKVLNATSLNSSGDSEKVAAMFILGLGSLGTGMLPAIISDYNRRRFPLTTSLMLCFGAGILLATSLIHILPEVRRQMSSDWAEISLCGGFFIIYFIDEFVHYFFGEAIQHSHTKEFTNSSNKVHHGQYKSLGSTETAPLLSSSSRTQLNDDVPHQYYAPIENSSEEQHQGHNHAHCSDKLIEDANARICHTSHTEPCSQSMTGTLGLFVALSLHSAIEGLAIGVQNSSTKVIFLLGAVACHKFVMGFCLGLEFRSNPQNGIKTQFIGISVFALGATCGICVGMLLVDIPSSWLATALPVIQGLAGGTLFYVTVCEVIPREKARWHQNTNRKAAGFYQFLAVFSGFAIMCVINFYLNGN